MTVKQKQGFWGRADVPNIVLFFIVLILISIAIFEHFQEIGFESQLIECQEEVSGMYETCYENFDDCMRDPSCAMGEIPTDTFIALCPPCPPRKCVQWDINDCPEGSEKEGVSKDETRIYCTEPATKENTCSQWNPYDGSCMAWSSGTNGTFHYDIPRNCTCYSNEPCAETFQ